MRSMRDKHTRSRCSSRGKKIEEFLEERGGLHTVTDGYAVFTIEAVCPSGHEWSVHRISISRGGDLYPFRCERSLHGDWREREKVPCSNLGMEYLGGRVK